MTQVGGRRWHRSAVLWVMTVLLCQLCTLDQRGYCSDSQGLGEQCDYGGQARVTSWDKQQVWHRCCWGIKTLGSGRRWSQQTDWGKHSWLSLGMSCPMVPTASSGRAQSLLGGAVSIPTSNPPPAYMQGLCPLRHGCSTVASFWVYVTLKW